MIAPMFHRFRSVLTSKLLIGPLLGVLSALIVNGFLPRVYESEAVIELVPIEGMSPLAMGYDWVWGGRVGAIRGRECLDKVIARLDLAGKWGVDSEVALKRLREMVVSQGIRGTERICIRVRHAERVLARDVCAGVVTAYQEHLRQLGKKRIERLASDLKKELSQQEEVVNEALLRLDGIERTRRKNIRVDGGETLLHLPDSEAYVRAKSKYETERAVLLNLRLRELSDSYVPEAMIAPIRIHRAADLPGSPVYPIFGLALGSGALLGWLCSWLWNVVRRLRNQ